MPLTWIEPTVTKLQQINGVVKKYAGIGKHKREKGQLKKHKPKNNEIIDLTLTMIILHIKCLLVKGQKLSTWIKKT